MASEKKWNPRIGKDMFLYLDTDYGDLFALTSEQEEAAKKLRGVLDFRGEKFVPEVLDLSDGSPVAMVAIRSDFEHYDTVYLLGTANMDMLNILVKKQILDDEHCCVVALNPDYDSPHEFEPLV